MTDKLRVSLERVPDRWTLFRSTEGRAIISRADMRLLMRKAWVEVRGDAESRAVEVRRTAAGRVALDVGALAPLAPVDAVYGRPTKTTTPQHKDKADG